MIDPRASHQKADIAENRLTICHVAVRRKTPGTDSDGGGGLFPGFGVEPQMRTNIS
jgi:hypothetical protein